MKLERLVSLMGKAAGIPQSALLSAIGEDVKTPLSYKEIMIKHGRLLIEASSQRENLIPIVMTFIREGRPSAVWRFLEYTRFRNHVLAAKHRAEDYFEEREETHPLYSTLFK
jgi:hypothetical protein